MIVYLIVGGLIGWLACIVVRAETRQAIIINLAIAMVSAIIGGDLIAPLLGGGLLIEWIGAILGAVAMLAIVNLVRRHRSR